MGTIYKRGKILWIKYHRAGKPYYESTKSSKEANARRLLKRREGEIADGKLPGIYFDKILYDELAADLLNDYELNGRKSLNRLKISLEHLEKSFTGYRVVNISTARIKAYIDHRLEEGAAHGTINRELAALKRMMVIGSQSTPPKVNRVPFLPMLKESNVRKGFFEHGDFIALRNSLPAYLAGLVTFAYKTGWRLSEITGLTWDRVDLDNGIVTLNPGETKNDQGRTVYLDEELRKTFVALLESRKKGSSVLPQVFLNEDGKDCVKRFDKAWASACIKAGFWAWGEDGKHKIPTKLFHDLRRTAVRNMVRAGIPERVAMMISGHKTRSVFDRYNIVSDTDLKEASNRQKLYLESQTVTKTVTVMDFERGKGNKAVPKPAEILVGRMGLEPTTNGLKVRCSTN